MSEIKKIQYYECEDGERFEDWSEAKNHQRYLDVLNLVANNLDGDSALLEQIARFIINHNDELADIFGWSED